MWLTLVNDPPAQSYHPGARLRQCGLGGAEILTHGQNLESSIPAWCRRFEHLFWHRIYIERRNIHFLRVCCGMLFLLYLSLLTFRDPLTVCKICKARKFMACLWNTFSKSVHRHIMCTKVYGRLQNVKPTKVAVSSHCRDLPLCNHAAFYVIYFIIF